MEKIVQILLFIPKWADEHILLHMAVLVVSVPHLVYEDRLYGKHFLLFQLMHTIIKSEEC
jgi:hypothetical protein